MTSPVVVLDIGASNVRCFVGEADETDSLKVLGMGAHPCRGIRRSAVIDMPKVVESIRAAVAEAERAAGLKITGAYVGVAGHDVTAHSSRSAVAIAGASNPIDESDVQRALAAAEQAAPPADAVVLHRFIQSYAVDGEPVQNPLWLHGNKLEVETLTATASNHSCTTLQRACEEAGLDIAGFVSETVAAASALLTADEREMGVAILDIGAGTSDLAVFHDTLRHLAEIPFGGEDITRDLSVVLNMSPREAEELKRQHGAVCCTEVDAEDTVTFHTTAGRPHTIIQQQLNAIIEARQQEILEFVAHELQRTQHAPLLAAGLICTGGGALLRNLDRLGEEVLGFPVRLGVPRDIVAPEQVQDPACATAIGLLRFVTDTHGRLGNVIQAPPAEEGFFDRLARLFSFL